MIAYELVDGEKQFCCPKCGKKLAYFSGLSECKDDGSVTAISEYLYCADCNDVAYTLDGERMCALI